MSETVFVHTFGTMMMALVSDTKTQLGEIAELVDSTSRNEVVPTYHSSLFTLQLLIELKSRLKFILSFMRRMSVLFETCIEYPTLAVHDRLWGSLGLCASCVVFDLAAKDYVLLQDKHGECASIIPNTLILVQKMHCLATRFCTSSHQSNKRRQCKSTIRRTGARFGNV